LDAASFTAGDFWTNSVYFNTPGASVVWGTSKTSSVGTYADFPALAGTVGSWCGAQFLGVFPVISAAQAQFPQSTPASIAGVTLTRTGGGSNSFASTTGNQAFTANTGSVDTTAPTCTVAGLTPATLATQTATTVTVATTCTDGTGVGIAFQGVVARATATTGGIYQDFVALNGGTFNVPQFQAGSVSIIGVLAIDYSGNGVVYGGCGDYSNPLATLCGGSSSSSTIVASFAVVIACILAVLSL
jgi:hypothetical protein